MPFCPGHLGDIKGHANHSHSLFTSSLASIRTDQPKCESTFSLLSSSHTFGVWQTCLFFLVKTSSRPHLIYEQLVLRNSFYINPPKPMTPRSIKLDVLFHLWHQHFNSCSVFSNSSFVLTTVTWFLLWHSAISFLLNSTTVLLLPATYSTRVLSFRLPLKHCWNLLIFLPSSFYFRSFNITGGNLFCLPVIRVIYYYTRIFLILLLHSVDRYIDR